MATLSKTEKEALARRAEGQLKRKATLAAKKAAAAASAAASAAATPTPAPVMALDPAATLQYLQSQFAGQGGLGNTVNVTNTVCSTNEYDNPPTPQTALNLVCERLDDVYVSIKTVNDYVLMFQERIGGPSYAFSDITPDPEGLPDLDNLLGTVTKIDALLTHIGHALAKHMESVQKLNLLS